MLLLNCRYGDIGDDKKYGGCVKYTMLLFLSLFNDQQKTNVVANMVNIERSNINTSLDKSTFIRVVMNTSDMNS